MGDEKRINCLYCDAWQRVADSASETEKQKKIGSYEETFLDKVQFFFMSY